MTENKQLTGNQVRQMFLDFFASKGSMIEPGASLIPHNDPTLLWINAGVSALKKYFDGTEKPKCNRICNAQKSIRTNDIENVGKTARHHTFFEMLGNFSIGDYFKQEAIPWAWEFLTSPEWVGFDPKRMYVTVYPDDEEAYNLWIKVGMNPAHTPSAANRRTSRSFTQRMSSHSAGSTASHPAINVRWGSILNHLHKIQDNYAQYYSNYSDRLWTLNFWGETGIYEVFSMYEQKSASYSESLLYYNANYPGSMDSMNAEAIQRWIDVQFENTELDYTVHVDPEDRFATVLTCADTHAESDRGGRIYFFMRRVDGH